MLLKVSKKLRKLTATPESYLTPQENAALKLREIVKSLYDFTKSLGADDDSGTGNALDELIIDQMDEEQIWQQLELNNEEVVDQSLKNVPAVLSIAEDRLRITYQGEDEGRNSDESEADEEEDEHELDESMGEDEDESNTITTRENAVKSKKKKPSIVDDTFFKLAEMEEFLQIEDQKEMKRYDGGANDNDDSDIDYFQDMSDDEDDSEAEHERNLKYGEYFDPEEDDERGDSTSDPKDGENLGENDNSNPEDNEAEVNYDPMDMLKKRKQVKFDLSRNSEKEIPPNDPDAVNESSEDDEIEDDDDDEVSNFRKRQKELRKQAREVEKSLLAEKPWQMKGEINVKNRPHDALIDEDLDFDLATRPAPIITLETTMKLEDIIKQRIRDQAFDDVERKQKPNIDPLEFKKELVLDQEKSKLSLAQIYEQDFLKAAAKADPETADRDEPESKEKQEIRRRMRQLFAQLDALSNYHFTPKPAEPELKIITNTPAINMEEVAPLGMSDAQLLAPEEIKAKLKGELMSKDEMTKTDKKRLLRQKKQKQRQKKKLEEEKEKRRAAKDPRKQAKLDDKKLLNKMLKSKQVEKMKVADEPNLKSTFFSRLQEKVKTPGGDKKKKASISQGISAKFYKL